MIHRLIGGEATDRRHNAERIRGQHDNVLRLSTDAAHFHIRNERQGIGCPGVLGQRFVVEVQDPRMRIHHDIFKQRTEHAARRVNLRFRLG